MFANGIGVFADSIRVNATATDVTLQVAGALIAAGNGIELNGGDGATLTATGSILSQTDSINTQGLGNRVNVADTIDADAAGVFAQTGSNEVTVSSTVNAGTDGIAAQGGSNQMTVSGTIDAGNDGIVVLSGNNSVEVTGTMIAVDFGILTRGSGNIVAVGASGYIRGGSNGTDAGDFSAAVGFASISNETNTLVNGGTIVAEASNLSGRKVAVLDTSGALDSPNPVSGVLSIVNTGLIDGDVLLFAGDDVYNAFGTGRVNGIVEGGDGEDAVSIRPAS